MVSYSTQTEIMPCRCLKMRFTVFCVFFWCLVYLVSNRVFFALYAHVCACVCMCVCVLRITLIRLSYDMLHLLCVICFSIISYTLYRSFYVK